MTRYKIIITDVILDLQINFILKVDCRIFYQNLLINPNILKIYVGYQQKLILLHLIHFHQPSRVIAQQNHNGIYILKVLIKQNGKV
jgi:hypothetical protein